MNQCSYPYIVYKFGDDPSLVSLFEKAHSVACKD
jgi:hypothetical protein